MISLVKICRDISVNDCHPILTVLSVLLLRKKKIMALEWSRKLLIILVGVSSLCKPCHSAPKYSFVHQATTAPLTSYHDYIIIGGGTAGCALAATLSEKADVLLLERGGSPYGNANVEHIDGFAANIIDHSPSSPAQRFVSEDGVVNARARVLGGGSAINAGFFTRASRGFVADAGWDEALVNRSYEWVEHKVAFKPPMLQFQSAVKDGLLEVGVLPDNGFTYDHIIGTKVGGTIFDQNGHRHTAADLLEYADTRRTTVYLHAIVHKILFDTIRFRKPTAAGVLYMDQHGIMHKAYLRPGANNEIILSAGALGSPQMLMLSGIGPADQLIPLRIKVLIDQDLVGQGMSDNPMNALFIPSPNPVEVSLIQTVGITRFGSFIEAASGDIFALALAINRPQGAETFPSETNNQSNEATREQTTAADRITGFYDIINSLDSGTLNAGIILEKADGPLSTGYLRLRTTNPDDNPSVTFNYFQEPEDLARCVQGMQTIIKVIESNSFSRFRDPNLPVESLINIMVNLPLNLRPKHFRDAFSLEQFCIDTVMTIWHYHGGCQVGKVVDKDYKVYGTDRLRVIDGSTFYSSPGTNPQATVMMLGRYMGQRILAERNAV